ncbi:hypothetical protein A1O3_02172 [Capronia epimyces CBS 606.96]|uniref:Calcineurin-like phosphoesterase domain-containing protein n=1 Tax=Capronia epimyces CBS 606.96 TaxID=1182542 RepID=W9Y995_9EURO|nr:uncharacterized protein A1O3_02172 [Capronia epimyces CBS 606.96]EXJ89108.1 hypothetical protein A1O3_02172 [Capronia epimyces CBS 606.96]
MDGVGPFSFKTSKPVGQSTDYMVAVVVDLGTMESQGLTITSGNGISKKNMLAPGEVNTIDRLTKCLDKFLIFFGITSVLKKVPGFLLIITLAEGVQVYESTMNDIYDELTPVTAYKPYIVGPGNHDSIYDNGGYPDTVHNIYTLSASGCLGRSIHGR